MRGLSPWMCLISGGLLAACFHDPPPLAPDADVDVDAAPTPCEPNTVVCDDDTGHYIACGDDGLAELEMDCPLGCATPEEACLDIDPSNGLALHLDMAREVGLDMEVPDGATWTVDTDSGEVTTDSGDTVEIPHAPFEGIRVLMFRSLVVRGTLKAAGELPLALLVDGDLTIDGGVLDVSADLDIPGPGAITSLEHDCVGDHSVTLVGGGGGGRVENGGRGGGTTTGGGLAYVDDDISPLLGGCDGGGEGIAPNGTSGGGGGGAVQVVSRSIVAISGGGAIDASGGGAPLMNFRSGGGGSGGAVLIEAPSIMVTGSGSVVSTKGGSGKGPGTSAAAAGGDGGTDAAPAPGGRDTTAQVSGGAGGTETTSPGNGQSGGTEADGAGGGSAGQARFNSVDPFSPGDGSALRSHYSTGNLNTRVVP